MRVRKVESATTSQLQLPELWKLTFLRNNVLPSDNKPLKIFQIFNFLSKFNKVQNSYIDFKIVQFKHFSWWCFICDKPENFKVSPIPLDCPHFVSVNCNFRLRKKAGKWQCYGYLASMSQLQLKAVVSPLNTMLGTLTRRLLNPLGPESERKVGTIE